MDPVEAIIDKRRSLRALEPLGLKADLRGLADELTKAASLAPSAGNLQPWRFVSVYEEPQLGKIRASLSPLNRWAEVCSLFIVVCASPTASQTGPSASGTNGPINYYLYDTGLASAFLMLRATDFDLVAHPIAGFDDGVVAEAIALKHAPGPAVQIVALIAIGRKSKDPAALERVPDDFKVAESTRPKRKPLEDIAFHNAFSHVVRDPGTIEEEKGPNHFDRDLILVNDDGKIYHLDQATLLGMTSVDELPPEEQVPYGFITELTNLGISVAAIPTIRSMNASIFCYLLNLGSLKVPPPDAGATNTRARAKDDSAKPSQEKPPVQKRPNRQYSGM
jgi:nitroreductase